MSLIDNIKRRMEKSLLVTSAGNPSTASADAVTINGMAGILTTESKSTAAGGTYTITLTNSAIKIGDGVLAHVAKNAGGNGTPQIKSIVVGDNGGSVQIVVINKHASAAFNGAHKIGFKVVTA